MIINIFCNKRYSEILIDSSTYTILHEKNMNVKIRPASLTKLMTLFVLFNKINNKEISLNDKILFSHKAANQKPSKLNVRSGDSINVRRAIYALVTKSANDVAYAVAEKISGNEKEFAKLMNYYAMKLSMKDTKFANSSGLHNFAQYTTANDMCKLAIALLKIFPEEFHFFSKKGFFHNGYYHSNHNKLLGFSNSEFLVDGLKTGFINASGFNIVASATKGNKRLIVVVMGANSAKDRDIRVSKLFNYGFSLKNNGNSTRLVSYNRMRPLRKIDINFNISRNHRKIPKDSILSLIENN